MKKFETPVIEIVVFESKDVIATSNHKDSFDEGPVLKP